MNEIEAIEQLKMKKVLLKRDYISPTDYKEFDLAIDALEKQLNGGWIPISERLPENQPSYIRGTIYIITTTKPYNSNRIKFAKYKEKKWIGDFGKIISDEDVLAWQPLPEPYKED